MNGPTPPFDEIVEAGDPEHSRLRSTHDLLIAAGAPPELPPWLAAAPPEPRRAAFAFRRRRYTAIAAVAVTAMVLFAVGYAIGGRNSPDGPVQTVVMKGPSGATGSIALLARDEAGNWPMTLEVSGLPPLPAGETYTLWLTLNGRLAESCGAFVVSAGTTKVPLNAPYPLKQFDAWVIVRTGSREPLLTTA